MPFLRHGGGRGDEEEDEEDGEEEEEREESKEEGCRDTLPGRTIRDTQRCIEV